jgi:hypothetical protein
LFYKSVGSAKFKIKCKMKQKYKLQILKHRDFFFGRISLKIFITHLE